MGLSSKTGIKKMPKMAWRNDTSVDVVKNIYQLGKMGERKEIKPPNTQSLRMVLTMCTIIATTRR